MLYTHRLHSSSFLGLPYRIRNINHKKELLWSLWVGLAEGLLWGQAGLCDCKGFSEV